MATFGSIPSDINFSKMHIVTDIVARDALTGLTHGDRCMVTGLGDNGLEFFYNGAEWKPVSGQVIYQVVAGAVSSVVFSDVPQHFENLRLAVVGRSNQASDDASISLQFNDITSGYTDQQLDASGTSATATRNTSQTSIRVGLVPAANSTASYPGILDIFIPAYTRTTFRWAAHGVCTSWTGTAGSRLTMRGGHRATTDAITKIKVAISDTFVSGSVLTLFGE